LTRSGLAPGGGPFQIVAFKFPTVARMAWFKKERKPRTSERVKLEIPADAWEKCDECGHIDIKDRFVRALNVCPNCGHHRRIAAQEYIDLLVDEGSWHELDARLRSTDPLHFENYKQRLETAIQKAGPLEGVRTGYGRLDGRPLDVAVNDLNFIGGAVVGFAGPRVIKQTIGQDLPPGFQTAEFLLEHGMIDAVVPRSELRDTTAQLLRHMAGRQPAEAAD